MADLPLKLTEAQQSRIWAAFKQLDLKLRSNQIGQNECLREAYAACAGELPHESAVALVVRYSRVLGWLPAYRQTDRQVRYRLRYRLAGLTPASVSSNPPRLPIPEAEQEAVISALVADLAQTETAPTPDISPLGMLKKLTERYGIAETVRRLDAVLRPDYGVTQSTVQAWRATEEGKKVSRPVGPEKRAMIAEAVRRVYSAG